MHRSRSPRLHPRTRLLPLALVAAFACNKDEPAETTGDTSSIEDPETLSYWGDVAPIYYERCVECHRDGGIAPFALDRYEDAATWASATAIAVEGRTMPPWLVTDDGTCNSWQHSRALSQAEIDTVLAWVDAGAPEGSPREDLTPHDPPALEGYLSVKTPMFRPEPEGGTTSKYDEYRCFALDPELDHDAFITGYEVLPGNAALVHHVLALPVDPSRDVGGGLTNLDVIEALDAESPDRLGWPCYGLAGDGVEVESLPVAWAPGQGVVNLPAGSGSRIGADDLVVVQVHYNMADPAVVGQSDETTLRLQIADEVAREGLFDFPDGLLDSLFAGDPYLIPPGEAAHTFTWSFPTDWYIGWNGTTSLELWGFFPHMHERGLSLTARVLDADGEEVACIGEVPRWDFGWQIYYFLQQPIVLGPGQQIEVSCTYDTRDADDPVFPGWGTGNEMC
ncbi:MAG: hypothetical protein KC636_36520, partial [Myxococcales bacterium]|nr:hypothetical protein [Myxococcales bacterium]